MRTSEAVDQIALALSKAQAAIKGAVKDSTNPHFKNKYADLSSVWDACRVPLTQNGLSVVQSPSTMDDGAICVTTMLMHVSGQWLMDDLALTPRDNSPQSAGSAITYARRYALAAFAGVAPEDDDANAASAAPAQAARPAAVSGIPAGYADWWEDMKAVAGEGLDALQKAWVESSPSFKAYTQDARQAEWSTLKAKAAKVAA